MPLRQMGGELSGSHRCTKQAIVNSVGPYKFSTVEFGAARCHISALCWSSGSPQKRLQRNPGKLLAVSVFRRHIWTGTEGTENQTEISLLLMNLVGASRSTGDMA